ncbi:MAG: CHAT domain-containing protein [Acidobacteriota bacterium]
MFRRDSSLIFEISGKIFWAVIVTVVSLSSRASTAQSSGDPVKLQRSALQAVSRCEISLKKTGKLGATQAELRQIENELLRSADLFLNRGDQAATIVSFYELARLKRWRKDWLQALTFYNAALELAQATKNKNYQIKILVGITKVLALDLNNDKAVNNFLDEAFKLSDALTDKQALFDLYDQRRALLFARGETEAALDYANRAFKVASESGDADLRFSAYFGRGEVHVKRVRSCNWARAATDCLGMYERAKSNLSEAQKLAQTLGYDFLGQELRLLLQDLENLKAIATFDVTKQVPIPKEINADQLYHPKTLSDVLVQDVFDPGRINFSQAPGEERRLWNVVRAMPESVEKYAMQGSLLLSRKDKESAMKSYLKAADLLEADRRRLADASGRSAFVEDRMGAYYIPTLLSLDSKRYEQAFELMERSRARALADLLQSQRLQFSGTKEREFYAESSRLNAQIERLQKRLLLRRDDSAQPDAQDIAKIEQEIQQVEGEYQRVKESIVVSGSRLQQLIVSRPVSLGGFQRLLRQDGSEALVYLVQDGHLVLWHLSGDAFHVRSIGLPRGILAQKVNALRQNLAKNSSGEPPKTFDRRSARELFLYLVQPALEWIKSDRLVIIPHDELNAVPFQALLNPATGRFLGDDFSLSYAPSATILASLKKPDNLRSGRLVVLADPSIGKDEAQRIKQFYPQGSRVMSERLVSKSDVKSLVEGYDLVHLSVHGEFDDQAPMLSALKFGPDDRGNEKLTAAEMFGLPLRQARLVVLSACKSGEVATTRGGDVLGMVRALLYAGANNLVLSSWEVDPEPTAIWMEHFYRAGQTMPPREAARVATAKLKATPGYSHPSHWSPFVVIGR